MKNPDGYGKQTRECGDTVEIFLKVSGENITSVSFNISGCVNTYACAKAVVSLIEGKKISEAWKINPEKIATYIKTLPPEEIHCAELAVEALRIALMNYREIAISPWKKIYRA
ncbi:MAG: iron-sulfur cluster assembly scaffold protein [Desulfobacterales bacterium]|nr:iron-sulfur cluster assembly scaffold protein [Desulfobacterales bacterium]